MNKDQIKGVTNQVTGEIKQQIGKLTGDTQTEVEGHARELKGKLQKGLGDAKEAVHDEKERQEERKLDR